MQKICLKHSSRYGVKHLYQSEQSFNKVYFIVHVNDCMLLLKYENISILNQITRRSCSGSNVFRNRRVSGHAGQANPTCFCKSKDKETLCLHTS